MIKKDIKIVEWIDVVSTPSWKTLEETKDWARDIYENNPCQTCGIIIYEHPKYIVIAASNDGGDEFGDIIMIPRSLIVKII